MPSIGEFRFVSRSQALGARTILVSWTEYPSTVLCTARYALALPHKKFSISQPPTFVRPCISTEPMAY
jgi:hypothetical protein